MSALSVPDSEQLIALTTRNMLPAIYHSEERQLGVTFPDEVIE